MSWQVRGWAWGQQELKPSRKFVLIALADRAGNETIAWPSIARIAFDTGYDRKTVIAALADLVDKNLIKPTGKTKGNGVKVYELIGVEDAYETRPESGTGKKVTSTRSGTATRPESGTATSTTSGTQNLSGNLSEEPNPQTPIEPDGRDPFEPPKAGGVDWEKLRKIYPKESNNDESVALVLWHDTPVLNRSKILGDVARRVGHTEPGFRFEQWFKSDGQFCPSLLNYLRDPDGKYWRAPNPCDLTEIPADPMAIPKGMKVVGSSELPEGYGE